jgi:endogenous inhibitor of DNA gyrase (YacG/DUF329 family)
MFSRMAPASICPTCKRRSAALPDNPTHPFCSRSCKLADLSNWFNERYTVPDENALPTDGDDEDRLLH